LPGFETMACVVHAGSFATIGEAYDAILKWVDENKYQVVGPGREIVLREPQPQNSQTDPGTVVEIQFPVQKAG
jgi:effector-binding domain-containing protein